MGRLEGKVAFITGGASGFGRAAALRFAREGAKVGLLDVAEEGGRATARAVEEAGGEALFVPADVRDEARVRAAVDAAAERFGRLDILFNNAGKPSPHRQTPIEDVPQEDWDHILDTNLKGMFLTAKAVVPHMRRAGGGAIVNTASFAGLVAIGAVSYAASKGGLVAFTRTLASQLAPAGIRVNAVAPGYTNVFTAQGEVARSAEEDRRRLTANMAASIPLGRVGTADDIVNAVLYLASDEASFVTGHVLVVDGGYTAR